MSFTLRGLGQSQIVLTLSCDIVKLTVGGKEVPQVLHRVQVELTLFGFGIELVLVESPKHFPNVFSMVLHVVQVD